MEDELHVRMVKKYLDYFKAHEAFEKSPSVRNYAIIRRELKELRILVKERYEETKVVYYEAKKYRRRPK
jgi:hypothetical protein